VIAARFAGGAFAHSGQHALERGFHRFGIRLRRECPKQERLAGFGCDRQPLVRRSVRPIVFGNLKRAQFVETPASVSGAPPETVVEFERSRRCFDGHRSRPTEDSAGKQKDRHAARGNHDQPERQIAELERVDAMPAEEVPGGQESQQAR
jgi:hypothetical protein